MYIGRFVLAGRTPSGRAFLGYRVSSRSFPNRRIVLTPDTAIVLPTADAPASDNPYIAYNCMRRHANTTVVANGSHVDPIIEKVAAGYPLRDALALSLLAMDYEHDSYNTPRIAAAWGPEQAYLAIITPTMLTVQSVEPLDGTAMLISTYELVAPTLVKVAGETPQDLAMAIHTLPYEHPVASLATLVDDPSASAVLGPDKL